MIAETADGAVERVSGTGSPSSSPATDGASSPATRTAENQVGRFEAPAELRRVVGWEGRRDVEIAPFTLDGFDLDRAEVITQTEPDLELIASVSQDLILTHDPHIEELLERVAYDIGHTDRLDAILDEYEENQVRRDEVRGRYGERIDTATNAVMQYFSDGHFYSSGTIGFCLQASTLADQVVVVCERCVVVVELRNDVMTGLLLRDVVEFDVCVVSSSMVNAPVVLFGKVLWDTDWPFVPDGVLMAEAEAIAW